MYPASSFRNYQLKTDLVSSMLPLHIFKLIPNITFINILARSSKKRELENNNTVTCLKNWESLTKYLVNTVISNSLKYQLFNVYLN